MTIQLLSNHELLKEIGGRLKMHRLNQNIPQATLAEMAGVSAGAIRNLERDGQVSMLTLISVVRSLGLLGELENLFVSRSQSIADMEREYDLGKRSRKRARAKGDAA